MFVTNLVDMIGRPFRHEAETRNLAFDVEVDPSIGRSITTDTKRLQQVLKNLLSNAFKFTAAGGVRLNVVGRGRRMECRSSDLEQRAFRCRLRSVRYGNRHSA